MNKVKQTHILSAANPPRDGLIAGVEIKRLVSHGDDRGFFREIVRVNDHFFSNAQEVPSSAQKDGMRFNPFGQWSHSRMEKNVVKAWHYHHVQIDWWYLAMGQVETVLFDNREESPTFGTKVVIKMGDSRVDADTFEVCVRIPPGVLHGLKVLTTEAHLFYITSEVYTSGEEGRFPYNSELVGHEWGENVITVPNDRRPFVPQSVRIPVRN